MQNNAIEPILNGTTQEDVNILTSKVEQATDRMTEILTRNEVLKQNKKDFTDEIINTFTQTFAENFEERHEKLLKGLFNKILKAKVELDSTDEDGNPVPGYLRKRIEELVMLIYVFKYFDYKDIEELFDEYGVKLDFKPIEQIINHYNNDGLKQNMKVLVEQAIQLKQKNEEINSDIEEDGVGSTIPLILEGKKMKSTMVGLEIDPVTEIAFDPYNNHKIVTGLINLYLETYYPGIDIQSLSLAGRHLNELGNAVLKLTNGQEFKSSNYYKDTLKYLDILYQMDGSAPPEMRVLKEMDSDDRTRPTSK